MPTTITQQQLKQAVGQLERLGTDLERQGSPDWAIPAIAAAILESLRLGLATIEPTKPAPWIGIDLGTGDRTVFGAHHA